MFGCIRKYFLICTFLLFFAPIEACVQYYYESASSNNVSVITNNIIIVPTATILIQSKSLTDGMYVRTLGYYKENDGGGGLFMIQKKRPVKSETVLFYTLANGLYANCVDTEVVLPRYGGIFVNQMLDNAKPFLRPGIRDVIVLPPSNINHPGCSQYVSGNGSRICFWQVNAPILFDDRCSHSEVFFHDEIVVSSSVSNLEAVLKVAGPDKPEDITFVTPVTVGGRHLDVNNTIVAQHGVLIEDGARIIFGKLQSGFARNCITLGGGNTSNEVEFYANFIEAGSCLERGLYINDENKAIRFNIDKMQLQAPIGKNITWIYAHGNITQSSIGTLFCTLAGSSTKNVNYKVFDIKTGTNTEQVLDIDRVRISQCVELGSISGGIYKIGSLRLTTSKRSNINIQLEANTIVFCEYLKLENPEGDLWMVTGKGASSVFNVQNYSAPPQKVKSCMFRDTK